MKYKKELSEKIELREKIKSRKHPKGKKKWSREYIQGDEMQKNGKWVKKERLIDRENNRYYEKIIDPETKEVIHKCDEPLTEHTG
ncbi:MAG: hypothetical protein QXU98_10695, partial [Candidatus Parvarchaeota archaeon]